jgi:hypothetical protein
MADDALEAEVRNAERAKQILEDPFVANWFKSVSDDLIAAVSSAKDEKEAFRAAVAVQVFGKLRQHMLGYVETGKMAAFQIEHKKRFGMF